MRDTVNLKLMPRLDPTGLESIHEPEWKRAFDTCSASKDVKVKNVPGAVPGRTIWSTAALFLEAKNKEYETRIHRTLNV